MSVEEIKPLTKSVTSSGNQENNLTKCPSIILSIRKNLRKTLFFLSLYAGFSLLAMFYLSNAMGRIRIEPMNCIFMTV